MGIDALVHNFDTIYYRTIFPIVQVFLENLSVFVCYDNFLCKQSYVNSVYRWPAYLLLLPKTLRNFDEFCLSSPLYFNFFDVLQDFPAIFSSFPPLEPFFAHFVILPKLDFLHR